LMGDYDAAAIPFLRPEPRRLVSWLAVPETNVF
jgi:hypothetical protein